MKTLQQELIDLISDDGYAITFQSMSQYRTALIKHLKSINSNSDCECRAIGSNEAKEKKCHGHEVPGFLCLNKTKEFCKDCEFYY